MYVYVALQAVRELLKHYFAMRLTMAFLTLWNVFMSRMALCARYLPVSALRILYLLVFLSMTGGADFVLCGIGVRYLERLMHGMACQTFFHGLPLAMWLMAFHTGRNVSMFVMMTKCAVYLGMFARVLLEHLANLGVARGALFCELRAHSHLCFRSVRICVTSRTCCEFISVDKSVACLTLRHDGIPVLFDRIVAVIRRVTVRTIELMLATSVFYSFVDT